MAKIQNSIKLKTKSAGDGWVHAEFKQELCPSRDKKFNILVKP
jgi:hypothetical protein